MKNIYNLILIISIIILYNGCTEPAKKAKPNQQEVEEIEIVFDENDGEASLTRNFYFLFDGSGSMDNPCSGEKKITGAKNAINKFLDKIPEDVNLGLLVFGVRDVKFGIEEVVPLGPNNRNNVKNAIMKTSPQGGTPLGNATLFGVEKLVDQYKRQLGYGEYRLIVVTDGHASDIEHFEQSLNKVAKYPFIALYGIGLCMDDDHILNNYAISYTDAHNYDELGSALEETIAELPDFDPTDFNPDDFIIDTEEK